MFLLDESASFPTTMRITTSPIPPGSCIYRGNVWANGAVISEGQDGSWCYITLCSEGQILHGDDFNCGTTHAPTTTPSGK